MQAQAVIRRASRQDVPAVVALAEALMDFHKDKDPFFTRVANFGEVFARFIEENICNDDACVLVATIEDTVVGYCQGMVGRHPPAIAEPDYGQILDIFVAAHYRKSGIGALMFRVLYDWFAQRGLRRIEVRHSTHNLIAERFWTKMGFEPYLSTAFMNLRVACGPFEPPELSG